MKNNLTLYSNRTIIKLKEINVMVVKIFIKEKRMILIIFRRNKDGISIDM